ncbi:hypothetical protein ASPSYDRAFT_1182446 [Aspergillus sydowii CBS 593.65]|uniref:Carrier domain-containing protein n=1 Tax=Aspergillus sydowii CBS 593.65 TaxID=1036612 RepID=A0A1L9TBG4_9EURO|nr:uncharacterized protein ASPSYDRAFT_1182446 [Aspergillus sydowii CBS 593.65]OJJ56735.1 hypothetical protein ASPSYDRAFT_1182446 [Aspergillus sydowii CBS 593.65]
MGSMYETDPGRRLLPSVVDHWAAVDPKTPFCNLPNAITPQDGFHPVSFGDISHCTDFMCGWIEALVGRGAGETVAYLGVNDIRYLVVFLACNKMGYNVFLPSTRNSDEAHVHLLQATSPVAFLYTPEFRGKVQGLRVHYPKMNIFEIPSLDSMLAGEAQHYPYTKSFEEEEDQVSVVMHTSGTTGLPKPIYLTHGFFFTAANLANYPLPRGRSSPLSQMQLENNVVLTVTPFFHIMGFFPFIAAILLRIPFSVPPLKPLSGQLVMDIIEAWKPHTAFLPPSLIEDICSTPGGMNSLAKLNRLYFGGAPLAPKTGDILRERVSIICAYGSTEMGLVAAMIPEDSKDWSYFDWAPGYNTFMDPVGDDLYELVLRRGENRDWHAIFHTFPTLMEYHTKDLFRQHPTKPNLWQYAGRLDDIIVLSNGEKFNPVTMEKRIEAVPLVSRALVVGQGRFQAALLLEPNWDLWDTNGFTAVEAFIGAVWPQVQDANESVPTYARVMRDHIGIAARVKPFKTTAKGSTQRRQVNDDYKSEIEELYNRENDTSLDVLEDGSLESVEQFVRRAVINQLGREIGDEDDLYVSGFDSLQTTSLANTLSRAIKAKDTDDHRDEPVTAHMIYNNPSIASLSLVVTGLIDGTMPKAEISRIDRINELFQSFTNDLPGPRKTTASRPASKGNVVLLTGSTGSFGSYVLDTLLGDPSVKKIYCLNRSLDAESRQTESHHEKRLRAIEPNRNRLEFVQADFSEDQLGLPHVIYTELLGEVNVVIHNAWKVDFNQSLASFHPMIKSVRSLVNFSSEAKYCPHLFFVSSISSIGAWDPSMGHPSAPEGPVHNPDAALKQGYAESKHIAERLCYTASDKVDIPTTILRVLGSWNSREWIPALMKSSISLGQIPSTLGGANEINWIPIDSLAEIVWEIIQYRLLLQSESTSATFHLVNPRIVDWTALSAHIGQKLGLQTIALSSWIQDLDKASQTDAKDTPAVTLLGFFRGLLRNNGSVSVIDVSKAMEASNSMRRLEPVTVAMMDNWARQWVYN